MVILFQRFGLDLACSHHQLFGKLFFLSSIFDLILDDAKCLFHFCLANELKTLQFTEHILDQIVFFHRNQNLLHLLVLLSRQGRLDGPDLGSQVRDFGLTFQLGGTLLVSQIIESLNNDFEDALALVWISEYLCDCLS